VTLVLIRYGEIGLKSRYVRKKFEELLIADIKKALSYYGVEHRIRRTWGRIFVEVDDFERTIKPLENVFGIKSFSPVVEVKADLEGISRAAAEYAEVGRNETFAVRARRTGNHDFTSQDIAIKAGKAVEDATHATVNLVKPDREIFIEVRDEMGFIFSRKIEGTGGLPYGSQGKVTGIVEDEKDLLASWLMMRRGCAVEFVCNESMANKIEEKCMWRNVTIHIFEGDKCIFAENLGIQIKAMVTGDEFFEKRKMPVFCPLPGFYEVIK